MANRGINICLVLVFLFSGFQIQSYITADQIIGTYSSKIAFLHDQSESELNIRKNFQFEEIIKTKGNNYSSTIKRAGTWFLKGDTLLLVPKTLKKIKRTSLIRISRIKENINCPDSVNLFCKSDTLIYKGKGLWTIKEPIYETYIRRGSEQ